jgi:hypothetical protein
MSEDFRPGFEAVKPVDVGARGSMRDVARPWDAVAKAGEVLSQTGDRSMKLAFQQKEAQAKRTAAEMELAFDKMHADYKQEIISNPNMSADEANAGWEKLSEGFIRDYAGGNRSQLEQDIYGTRARQLTQRAGLGIQEDALIKDMQLAKQSMLNMVMRGEQTGNRDMVNNALDGLSSYLPVESIEKIRIETDHRLNRADLMNGIKEDPVGSGFYLGSLEDFKRNYPGYSDDDYYDALETQRVAKGKMYSDGLDLLENKLALDPSYSEEKLRSDFKYFEPAALEDMVAKYSKFKGERHAANIADPNYQRLQVPIILSAIHNWEPKTTGYDPVKTELVLKAHQNLQKGSAFQKEILKAIDEKEERTAQTEKDIAELHLNNHLRQRDQQQQYRTLAKQSLGQALMDGILTGGDFLERAGFDYPEARDIRAKYDKIYRDRTAADRTAKSPEDAEKEYKAQAALFRQMYSTRGNKGQENLTRWEKAVIQAVVDGKSGTHMVEVEDPAAKESYHMNRGKVIQRFNQWVRENPQEAKDEKKVKQWFKDFNVGATRASAAEANQENE